MEKKKKFSWISFFIIIIIIGILISLISSFFAHLESRRQASSVQDTNTESARKMLVLFSDKTGHNDEDEYQDISEIAQSEDNKEEFTTEEFDRNLEELCFGQSATVYNPELAYMLMTLASGAYYKQCSIRNYDALGFSHETYNYYLAKDDTRYGKDSVAYTIGEKEVGGKKIVLVTIRGSYGDKDGEDGNKEPDLNAPDWKRNFNLGNAETDVTWHRGFGTAASEVLESLQDRYGKKLSADNTIYVVTGHSRGAAVANLVSVLISDNGVSKDNVYDYNFACPDVARNFGVSWNWFGDHDNIFNIGNVNDPVTWIPGALGDILGNASDSAIDLASLFGVKDLSISGSERSGRSVSLTDWGKFGRSYWFSDDWDNIELKGINFDYHNQKKYIEYLKNHRSDALGSGDMHSWEGVLSKAGASLAIGISEVFQETKGLYYLFLCPVDIYIKDSNGNVMASVVGDEVDYSGSDIDNVVILTEGDEKLIFVRNQAAADVEMVGTGSGEMTYVVDEGNMLGESTNPPVIYESIKIKKGKKLLSHVDFNDNNVNEKASLMVVNDSGEKIADVTLDGKELSVDGDFEPIIADYIWIILIIVIVVIVVLAIILILFIIRRRGKGGLSKTLVDKTEHIKDSKGQLVENKNESGEITTKPVNSDDVVCPACGAKNPKDARDCVNCGRRFKKKILI